VDPRLRAAVDASVRWYDDIFAVHRIPVTVRRAVWSASGAAPPWHSAVKTLGPEAAIDDVLHAMEPHEHGSVADSFGRLDLAAHGFDLLFEATWLHRPPDPAPPSGLPMGWSVVGNTDVLDEWNRHHETTEVLGPALLDHPRFRFLARHDEGVLTGGAVTHDAGPTVGLSNCWSMPGHHLDWPDVLSCVGALHPGRPVVDYAWGDDLDVMVAAGFSPLGPQLVWAR